MRQRKTKFEKINWRRAKMHEGFTRDLPVRQRFENALARAHREAEKAGEEIEMRWRPEIGSGLFMLSKREAAYSRKTLFATVAPDGEVTYGPAYNEEIF